ncbi:MAG TPA: hypothetical protein VEL09_14440 [Burkholderiales bacterium]|nr:hypothetical protein [Burkholderiales bacterium]
MIIQQRLTSRSSRSLAVMIGFAQPAGSRGTWRSDGDIDSGAPTSALDLRSSAVSPPQPQPLCSNRRRVLRALARWDTRVRVVKQRFN